MKKGSDLETQVRSFIAWIENGDSAIAPQNIGLLADFKSNQRGCAMVHGLA
jgi:hypothetical protein